MASVPATATANTPQTLPDEVNTQDNESGGANLFAGNNLLRGFDNLNIIRQIGLMIGLAASVALGVWVVLWSQEPARQPLLTNLSHLDAVEVTEILAQSNIDYTFDTNTGMVMVSSGDIHRARLRLASAGFSDSQTLGFEILDQDQGLGTSQFIEQTKYRRGLEGELARTIMSMRPVRSARVHLAIPRETVFVRDLRKPSASVFVDIIAGRRLADAQVDAIVNLVAGSVPNLGEADVTVVDQKGDLLSKQEQTAEDAAADKQFQQTRRVEETLNQRIASILAPVVGDGRFRSEVSADLDFTMVQEAEELFNPAGQALRSEQVLEEQRVNGIDGGVPGALANQPPGGAVAPEVVDGQGGAGAQPTDIRESATRNFEVDRTVSFTQHQTGQVRRLTVAVALDDLRRIDPLSGQVTFQPWPEAELQRLTALIRNAVGFDAGRGDSVSVINTPFAAVEVESITPPTLTEQALNVATSNARYLVLLLAALVLVFGFLRPLMKSLSEGGANARALELAADEEGLAELDELGQTSDDAKVTLGAGDEFLLPNSSEGYDQQLNAVKGLIAEDPARVAQVVRGWVNADG